MLTEQRTEWKKEMKCWNTKRIGGMEKKENKQTDEEQ